MKDSGIEWIGEIPQDWDKRKLKYIAKVETGGTPPRGDDSNFDGEYGIQWIKPDNILENNTISETKEKVSIEAAKNLPIISKGSTVVCCIGTVGKCAYVSEKSVSNQQINAVTFCDEYDSRYGFYSTLISKQEYEAQANKVVVSILNKFQQSNIFYPYCKINKQQNIADYLDKKCSEIDACLSDVNESIAKLQEYKKSIITEAVTKGLDTNAEMKDSGIEWIGEIPKNWTVSKLKYLGQAIIGLTYSPDNIDDEGFLVLRSSNIQEGKLSLNDTVIVNKEIPKKLIIKKDDLLICSRNGSKSLIGKTIMIKDNLESTTFGAFMTVFRSDYNSFIYYVLQSEIFNYHIETFLTSTINQLTTGNLNGIKITLPRETAEQQQIADYLDNKCAEIDNVIEDKKELANKLKEYKHSLIYECVTGKREVG